MGTLHECGRQAPLGVRSQGDVSHLIQKVGRQVEAGHPFQQLRLVVEPVRIVRNFVSRLLSATLLPERDRLRRLGRKVVVDEALQHLPSR